MSTVKNIDQEFDEFSLIALALQGVKGSRASESSDGTLTLRMINGIVSSLSPDGIVTVTGPNGTMMWKKSNGKLIPHQR